MTDLVLTGTSGEVVSGLVLSDGDREIDLVGTPPTGIYLVTFNPPVQADSDTYATSPDTEGAIRTRTQPENPTGSGTLRIDKSDSTVAGFWNASDDLQDLVRNAHRRKGTLTYSPAGNDPVTFDLESIRMSEWTHDFLMGRRHLVCGFEFSCRPYGRLEPRQILTDISLTGPIDSVELPGVLGHVDALGEAVFTDEEGEARDDVEWGIAEVFDAADPIRIEADDLVVSGFSGTFDTDHVEAVTPTDWLALCGLGDLPHVGRYRIKAWVTCETTDAQLRLAWQIGSEPLRSNPDNLAVPHLSDRLIEVDLGLVNIPGTDGWSGQIEFKADATGSDLSVYAVEVIPASRYGRARAPVADSTPTTYAASDAFDQTAANLDALTATVGGNWDSFGASTDFAVEDVNHTVFRATFSETFGITTARHAVLGPAAAAQTARVEMAWTPFGSPSSPSLLQLGLLLRSDATVNNCLACVLQVGWSTGILEIFKVIAGVQTVINTPVDSTPNAFLGVAGFSYRFSAGVDAFGNITVQIGDSYVVTAQDDDLATGGALASGQAGIVDNFYDTGAPIRAFDNFATWAPPEDHVIWPDKTLKLTHDAAQRTNGVPYGNVPFYEGKRLLIPPATRNNYVSRLVVKQDRNDLVNFPVADDTDELTLDLTVTERVLLTTKNL